MPDGETTAEPGAASTLDDPYEALARDALLEITPAATVGALAGRVDESGGAVSLQFLSTMPGYPDWRWTVSLAEVEGEAPTVLEVELMPGSGAVLAPDWIPWSDRLAEYTAAQGEPGSDDDPDSDDDDADGDSEDESYDSDEESEDDESDDELDDDVLDDDDVLGNDLLHGGDLDGVDIDTLDAPDDDIAEDEDPESDEDDDARDEDPDSDDDAEDKDSDDEQDKSY